MAVVKRTLKQVFRALENLSVSGVVVLKPDHPLMPAGPDILLGEGGHLLTVFMRGKDESDHHLSARLMAARIFIPRSVCVLLDEGGQFDAIFDHVMASGANDIGSVLKNCMRDKRADESMRHSSLVEALVSESEVSRKRHPFGGNWYYSNEPHSLENIEVVKVNGDPHTWLDAIMKANHFDGMRVVPREGTPLVAITESWDDRKKVRVFSYANAGILLLSPDSDWEILSALDSLLPERKPMTPGF